MNEAKKYGQVVAFSVIWSSAFVVGRLAVDNLNPVVVLSFRFIVSTIVLAPFWFADVRHTFNIDHLKTGIVLGILNNTMYLGFSFAALKIINPAMVIVIISCSPFITVLIGGITGQESFNSSKLYGISIGFLGVLTIASKQGVFPTNFVGITLAAIGTISFCTGTMMFSRKASQASITQISFYQSAAAAVSLSAFAILIHAPITIPSLRNALIIAYLAVGVTIIGMALWLHLIRSIGSSTASSIHLLNPAVGLILSYLVLGNAIGVTDVIGSATIIAGLLVILRQRR